MRRARARVGSSTTQQRFDPDRQAGMLGHVAHGRAAHRARTTCGPGCRGGWSASPPACRTGSPDARRGLPAGSSAPGCRRRRRRGRRRARCWSHRGWAADPFRASAIRRAVRAAVPDGASALNGWCSSMTSTDSKKRAACLANCIDSTAPIAKFGAMSTATSGLCCEPRLHLRDALVGEPGGADHRVDAVVDEELQVVHHDVGMGEVDDDLRSALSVNALSGSPASTPAVNVRSSAALDGVDDRRADLALAPALRLAW